MTETSPLAISASLEGITSSTSIDPSDPLSRQSHPRGAPMDAGDAPAITPEDQMVKTKRPLSIGGYLEDDEVSGRKTRDEDEVGYLMVEVERQKGQENTKSNDESFDDTEEEEEIEALVRFVIDKAKKDLYAEKITNCSVSADDSSSAIPERNSDECALDPLKDSLVTGEGIAPAESLKVKRIIDDIAEPGVDGPHDDRHNGQENVKGEEDDVDESNETAIREQEQDLDEMVRMVINEAARGLILERKEDIECILENAEKQAPVDETGGDANGDEVNFDGTNEMDCDLKFHDYEGRFKVCERGEEETVDGNGIIDEQTVKKNIFDEKREEDGEKEQVKETRDNDEEDEAGEFLTSVEEELDLKEGFVIGAARSSLLKNFDVFAFNELVARNENICSAGEQSKDGENADITDLTQGRKETLSRFSEDRKPSDMTEVPAGDVISRGDDQFGEQIGKDEGDSSHATEENEQVEMHVKETGTSVEHEKHDHDADERKEVKTEECDLIDCTPQDGESSVEKSEEERDNGCMKRENALKTIEQKDQYPDDEETKNSTSALTPEVIRQTTEEGSLSSQDESHQDANAANLHQQNEKKQDGKNEMGGPSEADSQAAVKTAHPTAQSLQATDNLSNKTQTSCHSNATTPVIGSQVPVTVCTTDSDLDDDDDDDDDICDSDAKPDDNLNTSESDWECLAIQRASKCQNSDGEPLHSWYPAYNMAHLGATNAVKEHKENSSKRLEVKMSETACQSKSPTNEKKDSMQSSDDSKITDMVNDPPALDRPTESLSKQAPPSHQPPQFSSRDAPVEASSGMALINDRLRKKILLLEQRLKQLALELTFLGDRNWRLEAYIDCLIKTLEMLDVTDVVDLDQKTLPLCLFKVKVKAGYKLGPYNGIPSRSLRSYAKEGRQAPFVDLSGWGDTDKPAKRPDPIDPTSVPSENDDVGLSASQMYDYESQLEELNIQNQILETQLRDVNERLQSLIGLDNAADGGQVDPLDMQQQQQQQHTDPLKQPQEVLQQHLQQIQEYHQNKGKEYSPPQQPLQKEQEQQQQQQPTHNVVLQQTEQQQQQQQQQQQCYVVHDPEHYPLPSQPQEMLTTQPQLPFPQQQQLQHQFQQYQPLMQQQQQQPNQQTFQQSWNPNLTEPDEEAVLPSVSDCDYGEQLCLQDPLEWPSLTESQAKLSAPCQSQTRTNEKPVPRANQQFSHPQSFANGPIMAVSSDPSRDKSTLYSSLTLPASTGSIPSSEDRYKTTHNLDKKSDKTRSSVSFQDLRNGRRFENEKRPRPTRYSPSPLNKSRSGIDTTSVPKFRRDEGSTRRYENRDLMKESFPLSTHSDLPSLLGQTWQCESPFHPNNQTASSFLPPSYHHRNLDRNRRFICYGESVLDSDHMDYWGTKQELPFSKDLSQSLSDSGQTFKPAFDGSDFEKFPGPGPNPGGFAGSSPYVHSLHYPRQNNKRPATPTRRGKPWNRAGLPRHSSYSSPLRSRNTLD